MRIEFLNSVAYRYWKKQFHYTIIRLGRKNAKRKTHLKSLALPSTAKRKGKLCVYKNFKLEKY